MRETARLLKVSSAKVSEVRPRPICIAERFDGMDKVHTLVIDQPLQDGLDGLPIDYTVGLEAGLIQVIDPTWNRRGRKLVLDEIAP